MFVYLMMMYKSWLRKKGLDEDDMGLPLRALLLEMHAQALAFKQRPELLDAFLDMLEGFMIEVKMTSHDAAWMRKKGGERIAETWAGIENMTVKDEKMDA
jgi:hypothetical protein